MSALYSEGNLAGAQPLVQESCMIHHEQRAEPERLGQVSGSWGSSASCVTGPARPDVGLSGRMKIDRRLHGRTMRVLGTCLQAQGAGAYTPRDRYAMKPPDRNTIHGTFDGTVRYAAQVFQRYYVWGKEQPQALLEDVQSAT